MIRVLNSVEIAIRRTEKGKMAVPVGRPQKRLVRCEDVAVADRWSGLLVLQVVNPVKLPLSSELIADPHPLVAEQLDRGQHLVV